MIITLPQPVISSAVIASSLTYCALSRANGLTTNIIRSSTGLIATTCGIATNIIAGPIIGGAVESGISFIGKDVLTPAISTSIDAGAILTAATAGIIGGTVGAAICAFHRGID